jgi:CheY-like chemotaxis protein
LHLRAEPAPGSPEEQHLFASSTLVRTLPEDGASRRPRRSTLRHSLAENPMPTQATFELLELLTEEANRAGIALSDTPLCAQAAFVRTLLDEVERRHPADYWIAPLHAQLAEELSRLEELIASRSASVNAREAARLDTVEVLAVDDDPSSLAAIAEALRGWAYPFRTAAGGDEALAAYAERPAEIVLSDWNMPGMNGLELCGVLKHRLPAPYIILVTAFPNEENLLDGARRNADDFLAKPVDLDELERRLSAASQLVRAVRSAAALSESLRSSRPPPVQCA